MLLHERFHMLLPASRVFFDIPVHERDQVAAQVDGFNIVRVDQAGLADLLQEGIFLGALAEAAKELGFTGLLDDQKLVGRQGGRDIDQVGQSDIFDLPAHPVGKSQQLGYRILMQLIQE